MININNIISLGRRCVTDQFLNKYKLKKYSTPFSSIFCDFETAIYFIKNDFKGFLNIKLVENHNYKQMHHWRLAPKFYYNVDIIKNFEDRQNINDLERLLIWTHFDPIKDKKLILRRCDRILKITKTKSNILYLYIDKIRYLKEIENIKNKILNIITNYNIYKYILYIIPCQDINKKIKLFYKDKILCIFLLKVTKIDNLMNETIKQNKLRPNGRPILDADIDDKNNNYDLLISELKKIYKFL